MKLVWSRETALQSYLDTIKSCDRIKQSDEAEFIAATAGGWNAKLIVEAWAPETPAATSIGLSVAARHTGGRHVCIVAEEETKAKYSSAMREFGDVVLSSPPEVVVGKAEEGMAGLDGVDFMVVDRRRKDLRRVLRAVKVGQRGAVLVCRGVKEQKGFNWVEVLGEEARVVRSVVLPVGRGLDIAHVGYGRVQKVDKDHHQIQSHQQSHQNHWIKHVDEVSGEEHMFRR